MKTIKSINDIIEINSDYPFHFMEHLKREFMELYEVLGDGEKLFEFNVPTEQYQKTEEFREKYKKRASIEGKNSELNRFHGLS